MPDHKPPVITEQTPIGPDVDLEKEDIRLADGTRLTEAVVAEIVEEVHRSTGRSGRRSAQDQERKAEETFAAAAVLVLIRIARVAGGLSVRAAAARAGVSKSWWSEVEKGYQGRFSAATPALTDAGTLARMAHAVGVESWHLREVGGNDPGGHGPALVLRAADVLEEIERGEAQEDQSHEGIPTEVREIAEHFHVDPEDLWADSRNREAWQAESVTLATRMAVMGVAASRLAAQRNPGSEETRRRA